MTVNVEKILSELTDTERRVVEYFLRHGGSAKDIASALDVSERTVYKALYKYRKLAREHGLDPSAFYLRGALQQPSVQTRETQVAESAISQDIVDRIKKELLEEITEALEKSVREAVLSAFEEILVASETRIRAPPSVQRLPVTENVTDSPLLRRLIDSLERLNQNFESFSKKIELLHYSPALRNNINRPVFHEAEDPSPSGELPSFIKDNPWIEVLQRKYK